MDWIHGLRNPQNWFALVTVPAWFLAFYFPVTALIPHLKDFFAGSNQDVFLQYGSAEEIEAAVRAHMAEYAPDCEIISNSFIYERISYS